MTRKTICQIYIPRIMFTFLPYGNLLSQVDPAKWPVDHWQRNLTSLQKERRDSMASNMLSSSMFSCFVLKTKFPQSTPKLSAWHSRTYTICPELSFPSIFTTKSYMSVELSYTNIPYDSSQHVWPLPQWSHLSWGQEQASQLQDASLPTSGPVPL